MNLRTALFALGALACTGLAHGQTITLNSGSACNYTSYTKTVNASGQASFVFQAPGCSTGGGSPSPGTVQFSSASYPAIDTTTGTATISVTRSGATAGGGTSSATVQAGPAGTCSVSNANLTWADAENTSKSVTVQAGATAGACNLSLSNVTNPGSPNSATLSVADSNAPGTVGFSAASQTVVIGTAVTIPVVRSNAGTNGGAASVSYTCNVGTSGSTVTSSSPLSFPGNSTQNITLSAPTSANPISCTLSIASGTATLGTSTHTVTVNNVSAPVCQTPTANPAAVTTSTNSSTSSLAVSCSNSPASYTWQAVNPTAATPAITGNGATATVTIPANATPGAYAYSVTATNAGGTSAPVQVTVTVNAAAAAGCTVRSRASLYPSWTSGNAYNTTNAPTIQQPANETYAFEFAVSDLLNSAAMPNALGMFQLYEAEQIPMTVSISSTPCGGFTDTPSAAVCQRTVSSGSGGPRYQSNGHQPDYRSFGYCELPPPGHNGSMAVYYVNVKFQQPPIPSRLNDSVVNAAPSTCQNSSCVYIPLYQRF